MKRTAFLLAFLGTLLWTAFGAVGLYRHAVCQDAPKNALGWTDIGGYDSEGYLPHFTDLHTVFGANHRHPMLGVILSPITAVGSMVRERLDLEWAKRAVLCVFAFIGAVNILLLWMIFSGTGASLPSRIAALLLMLSFAQTWILSGIAESYPVSETMLLLTLLMVQRKVADVRLWLATAALAGGITSTNAGKPLLAWLVGAGGLERLRGLPSKAKMIVVASAIGLVVAVVAAALVKWAFLNGTTFAVSWESFLDTITKELPHGASFSRRMWSAWNAFWCEPMILHGSVLGQSKIAAPYQTIGPHLVCGSILVLSAWSAIRNFREPVVRAALAMFSIDLILHPVIGWGLAESQIYCGHWYYLIPVLMVFLPPRVWPLTMLLAATAAAHNLFVCL